MAFFGCGATPPITYTAKRQKEIPISSFSSSFSRGRGGSSSSGQPSLEHFLYLRVLDCDVLSGWGHTSGAGLLAAGSALHHIILKAALVWLIGSSGAAISTFLVAAFVWRGACVDGFQLRRVVYVMNDLGWTFVVRAWEPNRYAGQRYGSWSTMKMAETARVSNC
jgi:hypothetical protein